MLFSFTNYTLDTDRRELRRGSGRIPVEPQVFDLLVYLIENRDRVVTKDDLIASVWGGRIVSDSTLTSRINAARKAVGDNGEDQAFIRTVARKGVRFVGEIEQASALSSKTLITRHSAPGYLRQEIQFCVASDGVRIAFASVGEGPPLVKTANWLNHLEYDWQSPIWSHLLRALAAKRHLVRYDQRGNGLSDWDIDDMSFEAFVRDLECVVNATALDEFPLLGVSAGCAVSIAYATQHPERVRRLVLYGGFARGAFRRGSREQAEQWAALATLMQHV